MPEIILANQKCEACEGGVPPLTKQEIDDLWPQLAEGWNLSDDQKMITREFDFDDFAGALKFVNKVGSLAEEEGHHPNIYLTWGKAVIKLTTHAIDGLSVNDFVMAVKTDKLY